MGECSEAVLDGLLGSPRLRRWAIGIVLTANRIDRGDELADEEIDEAAAAELLDLSLEGAESFRRRHPELELALWERRGRRIVWFRQSLEAWIRDSGYRPRKR